MTRTLNAEPVPSHLQSLPELPATITTPDGQEHSVVGDVWVLPHDPGFAATVKLDWTLLTGVAIAVDSTPVISARAVSLAKIYVLERMSLAKRSLKPSSGRVFLRAVLRFARWLAAHPEWLPIGRGFDWSDLTADMFEAWLTIEYRTKMKGNFAILVRRFYLWGADPDASRPDFTPALASMLCSQRIKGNAVGELVESRDKRQGPFTREELDLIFEACKSGAGKDQDRAITWTLLMTAIRPKQLYHLTNRDLELNRDAAGDGNSDGSPLQAIYRLRVRKIKQRGNAIKYHFLQLSEGCARLLLDLRRPGSGLDDPLFWWVGPSYNGYIASRLKYFFEEANLRSPRLCIENPEPGGPFYDRMPVSPRRFRYGIATDRIARGENEEDVAAMLGHEGTGYLHAYVETSPGIADDFQLATDYAIAPLIDLMEGRTHPSKEYLLSDPVPPLPPKPRPYEDAPIFRIDQRRNLPEDTRVRPDSMLDKSEARIGELIARARRKFPLIFPDQDFSRQLWDVAHLKERPNANTVVKLGFTTLTTNVGKRSLLSSQPDDALPDYFADVIKSWIVISNDISLQYKAGCLNAARHFWNFLSTWQGRNAVSFMWGKLSEGDILAFEQFLIAYKTNRDQPFCPNSILKILERIQRLIDFLASYGICRQIDYIPQTFSARQAATRLLDAKRLAAELKLPAPGVLESLGGIYHRLTTAPAGEVSDWVLILISAVAILVLTGLRAGELVTLPFDCEVEDKHPKKRFGEPFSYCYGIKYWVEKAMKKTMRVKWISPTAESVVRASVLRIKELTAAARERAKILETDPSKVTLPPEIASRTILTRPELIALIGQKSNQPPRIDPQKLLPQHGWGRNSYYYVKDLEAYLLSRRAQHLYTVRHDDGTFQMLSESLFIVFAKQSQYWQTNPCTLLVAALKRSSIECFLSSQTNVFKTYGEAQWQKELSVTPHCFRHWLVHIAYKGGMETHLLLRYFAKRYASGLVDYLHFSTDESDGYAPEELSAERFYAPV